MNTQTIIQTENLSKVYGRGDVQVYALDNINLQMRENEFVAIMGPSGSGKSTLMNILGCLDRLTAGRYFLAGEDVSGLNKAQLATIRNQRIGFIFQSFNLLAQTSALENVMLPLLYNRNGRLTDAQQLDKARQVLSAVGLTEQGRSTLKVMADESPYLVILDWKLPDLSCLAIIRAIRQDGSEARVPIIVIASQINEVESTLALLNTSAAIRIARTGW